MGIGTAGGLTHHAVIGFLRTRGSLVRRVGCAILDKGQSNVANQQGHMVVEGWDIEITSGICEYVCSFLN